MRIDKFFQPCGRDMGPLRTKFRQYAQSQIPDLTDESQDKKFLFSINQDSDLIAGISGNVYWNGLEIDILWVDSNFRQTGLGTKLVTAAEAYARENGAVIAFLRTVEAKEFYQKMGCRVYGVLEDRPIGTQLFHMKKRLDSPQ